jgi:DNA-binding transcriptional MerR regulator
MLTIGEFARLGQVSPRMLRHYDQLGILRPEQVDGASGYRSYGVAQLARLHRLVALRDLGFGLAQIGAILDEEPTVEQLRGMLLLRRAQIEQTLADEHARLRRVESHLNALEGASPMSMHDVVIKKTEPLRVAAVTDVAEGFGLALGPVFERMVPVLLARLQQAMVSFRMMVAWYEEPADDGSVVVHAGFDIGDQPLASTSELEVVELPVVDVAALIHRGSMDDVDPVYEALVRWIDASGYQPVGRSRELYLEWHDDDHLRNVTELQMPIAPATG